MMTAETGLLPNTS